ncbi:hypothetical protein M440DRAFT_1403600 [Trichoderma longibrachiatum ATCC 18648]|uniref:Uncharacterized protein n=1 Tax=Trichoderma longibrachiatum ATCC 18648 TaxID=983965 RepID=A0A2T4BY54_TRILO|nr:hypothetical protein M440DRAFT_1403600 [Trichoderma longibrachiatum ATCC 18648]
MQGRRSLSAPFPYPFLALIAPVWGPAARVSRCLLVPSSLDWLVLAAETQRTLNDIKHTPSLKLRTLRYVGCPGSAARSCWARRRAGVHLAETRIIALRPDTCGLVALSMTAQVGNEMVCQY